MYSIPNIYKYFPSETSKKQTRRIYYLDLFILSYIAKHNYYCYSKDISAILKHTSRRTINRHLSKLTRLGIIERHGNIFCTHTWYSIPDINKAPILELITGIEKEFKLKTIRSNNYILLNLLPVQVPIGHLKIECKHAEVVISTERKIYKDPCRPLQSSIPFKSKKSKSKKQLSLNLFLQNQKPQQTTLSRFFGSFKSITQKKLSDFP